MSLTKEDYLSLEEKAHTIRQKCIKTTYDAGSGHIGGSLSAIDILVILYYKYLNINYIDPEWCERDRLILSKGHAGLGLASILADIGYISDEELSTFNQDGSKLGIHLDSLKVKGVDASTGSLGHGFSMALGMGLGFKLKKSNQKIFCIMGDGECNEGSVWEAAMAGAHYNVNNVIPIIDRNSLMIDGETEDVMKLEPFSKKWEAFGYKVIEVDGHNFSDLSKAIEFSLSYKESPVVLICKTTKGCGIDFIQNTKESHYVAVDSNNYKDISESLDAYHINRKDENYE